MKPSIQPGRVVFSKKGRDKDRYFVVLCSLDADFVMISDGETRKIDKAKKKRVKHLAGCPYECPELIDKLQGGKLTDADIRKFLYPVKNETKCALAQKS